MARGYKGAPAGVPSIRNIYCSYIGSPAGRALETSSSFFPTIREDREERSRTTAMATSATRLALVVLVLALLPFYAVARAEPRNLAQAYGSSSSNNSSSPSAAAAAAAAQAGVSPTNGMGWYKGMAREFVNGHNEIRARYGAKALKWDNKLARQARRWSDAMRTDCVLRHSTGTDFAESLYIGRSGWKAMAHNAMDTWAGNEERIYDPVTRACKDGLAFKACAHFAFMVDPRFTRMGCARSECFNQAGVFITCNYYF